jgi:hypothetical protein
MMGQYEMQQQNPLQNSQLWGQVNPQAFGQQSFGQQAGGYGIQGQIPGLGQAAIGQPYGPFGIQQFGQPYVGALGQMGGVGIQSPWGLQHRQLTPQDTHEVVRQLVPLLPHIIAQAQQQQPQAAFGYGGFGQRMLTQQDVNEVVRQILPIVPQIVAQLQGQSPMHAVHAGYGFGQLGPLAATGQIYQQPWAQQLYQHPLAQQQLYHQQPFGLHQQHPYGQQVWPQVQAAFGGTQPGLGLMQRQLTQQDVSEVVRQLVGVIPQVIQNMQATGYQRELNR